MLYRRAPVEGQLESLRYLDCADIFSASLVNSAYSSIVESNRASLPKRAIFIRYWQGYPEEVSGTALDEDPDAETREEYEEYDAVIAAEGAYCVVGSLKIEDRSGRYKRIYRAFPVAVYNKGEEHPVCYPVPEQVEQVLRQVLFDRVLGVVERLDVNNYSTTDFSKKMFSLLCTAIEVPIRELHVRIENTIDATDIERLVEHVREKVGIHFLRFNALEDNYVKDCTSFGGEAVFVVEQCYDAWAGTLVEHILTSAYNPQCRLLFRLAEHNESYNESVSLILTLFHHIYTVFADARKPITLPPHGVWLHFPAIKKDSLPENPWIGVLGGVELSSSISLPIPKGVYSENGAEECKCIVYNIAANREHILRVCVGGIHDGGRLLVQLKLQERQTESGMQSL